MDGQRKGLDCALQELRRSAFEFMAEFLEKMDVFFLLLSFGVLVGGYLVFFVVGDLLLLFVLTQVAV